MMYGDAFEQSVRLRSPIEQVRDDLNDNGCMEMNPFMRHIGQQDLISVLSHFSESIVTAAKTLSEKTGVAKFNVGMQEDRSISMAAILCHPVQAAERNLRRFFEDNWMLADQYLRSLQKTPECKQTATAAMEAMENLFLATVSAPRVYANVPAEIKADFIFR